MVFSSKVWISQIEFEKLYELMASEGFAILFNNSCRDEQSYNNNKKINSWLFQFTFS